MNAIISWFQQGLSLVGPFILLLGMLIFVHELGHFLVAKLFGVRVEIFSLGFGRKILQFKWGDTTYCLSWIPLGGYVKMYGDDPTMDIPEDQKRYSFLHKPVLPRIAIVLAGPLMNLFFAIFLYALIATIGENMPSTEVGDIASETMAYEAGFRSGDKILRVDGKEVKTWGELKTAIEAGVGQVLKFEVSRPGESSAITLEAEPKLTANDDPLGQQAAVGRIQGLQMESLASVIGISDPQSPAGKSGLISLDQIVKINGTEINYFRDLEPSLKRSLEASPNLELTVRSLRDEGTPSRELLLSGAGLDLTQPILAQLGIESAELFMYKVKPGSPAELAGFKMGDKISKVNGSAAASWDAVVGLVKAFDPAKGAMKFTLVRAGQEIDTELVPELTKLLTAAGKDEQRYTIGIGSGTVMTAAEPVLLKASSVGEALRHGVKRSIETSRLIIVGIVKLIQGELSSRNVGGIFTIGRFASRSFEMGAVYFLAMMAFISVNLFLVNLLPIPILDGGHLVFFTVEALRGAPLSMRKMEIAQQVGLVLLMSLMAFALFNDITNILTAW